MLALPRLGCINLHASLLPKYRGAAPIQWAVAKGEAFTGNTTMLLEEGLDTGPILLERALAIGPEQTAADLFEELAVGGAPWWSKPWPAWTTEAFSRSRSTTSEPRWPRF
jgi:methionyl-tRNA formyltransferase